MHKKIVFVFFKNKGFWIFCIFLKFERKTCIFNIESVSYSVSLQPRY